SRRGSRGWPKRTVIWTSRVSGDAGQRAHSVPAKGTPLAPGLGRWRGVSSLIAHHFTVDVEEYFQVAAFERRVSRDAWPSLESRADKRGGELLERLAAHGGRGTVVVLGWLAGRPPDPGRMSAGGGHASASHGW